MGDGPSAPENVETLTVKPPEVAKPFVEVGMRMGGRLRIDRLSQAGSNFTENNKSRDFKGEEFLPSVLTAADRKTISELPIGMQDSFGEWQANAVINTIGERDSNNFFKGVKSTRLDLDISPTDKESKIDLSGIRGLQNTEESDPKDPSRNKKLKVSTFTLNSPVRIAGQLIDSVRVAIPALESPRAELAGLAQPEVTKPPLAAPRRRMMEMA